MLPGKMRSKVQDRAEQRAAALRAIDPAFTVTPDLTLAIFAAKTLRGRANFAQYNEQVARLNELHLKFTEDQRDLAEYSARMLKGVAAVFGEDSPEYEKAGAVRRSARKPKAHKPKPAAPATPVAAPPTATEKVA